jgi:Inner membrane protein YgaP-like, transmembrane domain
MNPVVSFLASSTGRTVRVVAGVILVAWGWFGLSGATGMVVALVGLVPIFAGIFDFCVFAPLFGAPLSGPKIRAGNK